MLNFYYRFIRENSELIKIGYGNIIKKEQSNQINDFIDRAFEYECLTYLEYLNKNGRLNTFYADFGNCNIENSELNRSIELDIAASRKDNLLVAECKFSKNKRTINDVLDMYDDLSISMFRHFTKRELYLFGASGFDDNLLNYDNKNLKLIDLNVMFNCKN